MATASATSRKAVASSAASGAAAAAASSSSVGGVGKSGGAKAGAKEGGAGKEEGSGNGGGNGGGNSGKTLRRMPEPQPEELSDKMAHVSSSGQDWGANGEDKDDADATHWWDVERLASAYSQPVAFAAVLLLGLCVGLLIGTRRNRVLNANAYRQIGGPACESWHWPVA